jgi:hypothetical protein
MKCSVVTVNFSLPHDVKHTCNKEIKGQNKSIIIVDLMRRAVKEAQMQEHRAPRPGENQTQIIYARVRSSVRIGASR